MDDLFIPDVAAMRETARKARRAAYRAAHKQAIREYNVKYYQAHRSAEIERAIAWSKQNPDRFREIKRNTYLNNKDKHLARHRSWRERNQDRLRLYEQARTKLGPRGSPEQRRRTWLIYVAKNSDLLREKRRVYREKNAEKVRAAHKRWVVNNTEKYKAACNLRGSRRRNAKGSFTAGDVAYILKHQRFRCAYCRKNIKTNYQIDHIVPIAAGGTNHKHNLQAACGPCNQRKWAKDPIDFAREMGLLI